MPLQGLLRRGLRSETDLSRRSLAPDTASLPRNSEHFPRGRPSHSSETPSLHLPTPSPAPSSNARTPTSAYSDQASDNPSVDRLAPDPAARPRLSLTKARHASDSQLSTRAKHQAAAANATPPVPQVPDTPSIITTSPTMDTLQRPHRKRPRLKLPDRLKHTSDRGELSQPSSQQDSLFERRTRSDKSSLGTESMRGSRVTFHEPGKRSADKNGAPPPYGDLSSSSLALPTARLSESSRSDGSAGESVAYAATTTTTHTVSTTTTFFRLPRRRKTPTSLFPLPDKVTPSESAAANIRAPRASTSAIPDSAGHSPSRFSATDDGDAASPLRSPSQLLPSASSLSLADSGMPLPRKNSTTSARSSKSSPSRRPQLRLGRRGRSSTINSLNNGQDDSPLPTPPLPSGRTSTSTAGRSSLGGILGLSHRLRQGSESPFPRHSSPGTPIENASKSNSFHLGRESVVIPEREADDTPAKYLTRLEEAVSRGVVASILSKSNDPFFQATLRSYMRSFAFFEDPMDMAIRKLLMEVELPKETQQIDRVLQSFANRYHECNPGVYTSAEQAYFIAFSLLILHTDVFNKNNKHKMLKPDYLKNTKGEGVSDDVLECFYDNISYTPFIHVEDDLDINGERIVAQKTLKGIFPRTGSDTIKAKTPKGPVDPYTLIIDHKLDTLRPPVRDVLSLDDPYGYLGTASALDLPALQNTFFKSGILQIVSARSRPDAFKSPTTITNPNGSHPGVVDIKITKVGVLWRKDAKKKKTRSPWQEWGAILTGAQLYFFRNTAWVKNLMHQYDAHHKSGYPKVPVIFKPPLENFKPEALMSTDDAVALLDKTYRKHKHAFTFVRQGQFEETFLADNEREMNDWLAKLNYAAAFRTSGVRMRGVVGSAADSQRSRGVRKSESGGSDRSIQSSGGEASAPTSDIDPLLAQQVKVARRQIMCQKIAEAEEKLVMLQTRLDTQLRNAQHLYILAPVQAKTRDQVLVAATRLAQQLRWIRVEMWRLRCHKDILALDLEEENKPVEETQLWNQTHPSTSPPAAPARNPSRLRLGRLESKNTSKDSPQRNSRSSVGSNLPAELSSKEKYGLGDIFQTPPQVSRNSSHHKAQASWELPPLPFGLYTSHATSTSNLDSGSAERESLGRQTSTNSLADSTHDQVSDNAKLAAQQATLDKGEIEVLREAGYVRQDGSSSGNQFLDGASEAEDPMDKTPTKATEAESSERSKVRRSLQRTIRDAHVPAHHRSKKGKDSSSSTAVTEDGTSTVESEGLARSTGSFTVHGKKASVITFGSEWHNMSPEDRLKMRKQAHNDGTRLLLPVTAGEVADFGSPSSIRRSHNSVASVSKRNPKARDAQMATADGEGVPAAIRGSPLDEQAQAEQGNQVVEQPLSPSRSGLTRPRGRQRSIST